MERIKSFFKWLTQTKLGFFYDRFSFILAENVLYLFDQV